MKKPCFCIIIWLLFAHDSIYMLVSTLYFKRVTNKCNFTSNVCVWDPWNRLNFIVGISTLQNCLSSEWGASRILKKRWNYWENSWISDQKCNPSCYPVMFKWIFLTYMQNITRATSREIICLLKQWMLLDHWNQKGCTEDRGWGELEDGKIRGLLLSLINLECLIEATG